MSFDLRRKYFRARRHLHWARSEGLGRLIEEDDLNPFTRLPNRYKKWRWRVGHGFPPGSATPVFLVGVQRSGTNMIVRGLETSPEFEVYNENNRRAFERFRLRSDDEIARLIANSRHRYVLFKPLCDSHQVDRLLDELTVARPGRALWAYRGVDGRVRSALAKFGDSNLRVLAEIAAGHGSHYWQGQRLSPDSLELIRSFDYTRLSPASASALFWYVRNSLYFDLKLDERDDVMVVSYDAIVTDPEPVMRGVCQLLDLAWTPALVAHIAPRGGKAERRLDIEPRIRERCDDLEARLREAASKASGWRPS